MAEDIISSHHRGCHLIATARCFTEVRRNAEQHPFLEQASGSGLTTYDGLAIDPLTGVLVVASGNGRRLSKEEAVIIRAALAQGHPVQFADRHQWRHFQVRHPSA